MGNEDSQAIRGENTDILYSRIALVTANRRISPQAALHFAGTSENDRHGATSIRIARTAFASAGGSLHRCPGSSPRLRAKKHGPRPGRYARVRALRAKRHCPGATRWKRGTSL